MCGVRTQPVVLGAALLLGPVLGIKICFDLKEKEVSLVYHYDIS